MDETLKKKEAIELLELEEKTFDNYFKNANEFSALPRENDRGRFKFRKEDLTAWKENYDWRSGLLTFDDYIICLDFALAMHYRNYVASDFGTGRQREFGQKVTNWVKGQLGELALKKFLKDKLNTEIELDFDIRDEFVPQDVSFIKDGGGTREPRIGVGIKTSKPKSGFLVLSDGDTREGRSSDVYVFCRVDIPDDHLMRISRDNIKQLIQEQQHHERYFELIPGFEDIPYEVAGWCTLDNLEEVTEIPGQEFSGPRYVISSGRMNRSRQSWNEFVQML